MLRASIVIPVHNRAALTRQCLETLLPDPPRESEIIAVDDGSTDDTAAVLERFAGQVRAISRPDNGGFAAACNSGAAAARGRYLVLLNNDTIPQPGWLEALVAHADAHPSAAVVGSKLLWPNETIQHAGIVIDHGRDVRPLYAGLPGGHPATGHARRLQAVTGACMLVRREDFERVGGFDAEFVNGYEDVDLCLRLGELGREVHYCPASVAYHLESATRGYEPLTDAENRARYRARWAEHVRPDDVTCYVEDGLVEVRYAHNQVRFGVSPLLGSAKLDVDGEGLEGLLTLRSRQVFDLMRENIRLSVERAG